MHIDVDLARRVEWSAAELSFRQAEALDRLDPSVGAAAARLDGGALLAFGPGRYVNRAMGVGLGGSPVAEIVGALADFYTARGMAPSLELCPLANASLLPALGADGYRLERFRNVYAHDLVKVPAAPTIGVTGVDPSTSPERKRILAGEAEVGSEARRISDEYCDSAGNVGGTNDFVAVVDGVPVACGSLNVVDDVGWIGGAATLAAQRGKGLQTALVEHRLRLASDLGCTIVAATALPDGQSARNLERLGFQLLYTQVVLTRH